MFHLRPVPFEPGNGWAGFERKCILLLGGGGGGSGGGGNLGKKEKDREKAREKAREMKRARQIYFAGIADPQSLQHRNDILEDDNSGGRVVEEGEHMRDEEEPSLTFFAVMCAVLAVGCHSSSSQGSIPAENPAFFFAISQQALGVWDTHTSSSGNAEETEQMDFLLASLISVVYLMLSGSLAVGEDEDKEGTNLVYPLVCRYFKRWK